MCYGSWLPDWIHFSHVPILKFCQLLSLVLSQVRNQILIYCISFLGFPFQPFRPSIWCSISPGAAALADHTWGSMQTSDSWGKRRFLAGTSYPRLVPTPAVTSVPSGASTNSLPSSQGKIWVTLQEQSSSANHRMQLQHWKPFHNKSQVPYPTLATCRTITRINATNS